KSLCQLPSPSHAGRFHPDGSQVAFQCGGRYPTHIEFYDLTGKHVRTLDLNMKPGASFGWNTDGTYFFAVSNNNVPAVWETDNWTPIALKNVPGGTHSSATFSQNDPLQLACVYYHGADARQYVAIHRVPGGELVSTVNLPRLVDGNWHPWVSWAGDGLLTAVRDGTVYLCDSTNGDVIQTLGCEKSLFMGADSFNWSGDNSRLSSIHMDGTTRIWSATGEPVAILRTHSRKKPTAAILNHDGTGLLVHGVPLTNDGKTFIRYFDVATGERKYEILGEWRSDQLPPLARHPEHDSFAFVGLDPRDTEKETPRIQIWNADDRTSSWIVGLPSGRVSSLSWMPDGVTLAIGFAHGTIELWNSQSSTQTWSQKVNREVIGIQPDQKGRVLAVQDTEQVTALDASTGEQLWTQKWHSGNPTHLQSGIWLTAAGELGILQQGQPSILSFPTGTPVRSLSSLGWSSRVVASSDGKKLAANRNAKALLVWDLEESSPLWTGQAVTEEASVSLTPGGQIIGSRGDLEGQLAWAIENGENDLELVDQEEFLKRVTRQEEGTQIEPAGKNAN
ncbi:MAG: WD40 repeat domain-containing protein, partial [Planctomycetaceae bacterium]|nr:WD40 repeat domain-containing protein [Planctomycetaceae bacterium]